MSKAKINRNPAKVRPGSNFRRPSGANAIAESEDERDLFFAALEGNRATRRLARSNLRKRLRAEFAKSKLRV